MVSEASFELSAFISPRLGELGPVWWLSKSCQQDTLLLSFRFLAFVPVFLLSPSNSLYSFLNYHHPSHLLNNRVLRFLAHTLGGAMGLGGDDGAAAVEDDRPLAFNDDRAVVANDDGGLAVDDE